MTANELKKEELKWEVLSMTLTLLGLYFAYKRYDAKKKQLSAK